MQRPRSALRVLSWMGALWVLAGCDQISQRLSSPAPRQPATPVQPVTIQPVPNATPNAGADTAADPASTPKTPSPPALPSSQQASPPAKGSSPAVAPAPSSRPDQETLSTARLRQSSPLATPPGGTTTDRNQDR